MVVTPWGNAGELRSRRLKPGPSSDRDAVAANQRERLMAAMVAAVDEHGYEAVRVADVVRLSGVSRSDFYDHFDDKLDCFLATADAIAALAAEQIAGAYATAGAWDERLRAATDKFLELVLAQPAAARLCLVEIYAAGPDAVTRLDSATLGVERAVRGAFAESPERAGMPPDMVRAIVGGLHKAVHARLRRREAAELARVVPELFEWGMSYRTPPQNLRRPRRKPDRGSAPRRSDSPPDRLTDAVTALVAERSYPAATISEIADRAKASLSTFYANFPTKEDAFRAAVERAQGEAFAAAMPAYARAADWREGIRDGLDAMFGFLAAEPAAASIAAVDVLAAGGGGLEEGDRAIDGIYAYLTPAYEASPQVPRIVGEAIGGGIYSLVFRQIRQHRAVKMRELTPTATFIALGPFVGADRAVAIANAPLSAA